VAKLSGLLSSLLPEPDIAAVLDAARDTRDPSVPALRIEGPSALRPFLAAGMADPTGAHRTVLAVTATDREAADLGAAAADLLGPDAVEVLPSWETLPHERLSPRPDTVGRRLSIFRRLADPAVAPRLVVTAARSLIQPIAPGLGSLDPVELRVGDSADFDNLLERLVELAYVRVEMVTARGEFAVRGGIVDIFPPTAEHPVRVEFWGDEVSELRSFAVADQRSLGPVDVLLAPGCRELLLTEPVRSRAAALARTYENNPALRELLEHLAEGIPTEGMESLVPVLAGGELELLTDLLPAGALVLLADPERIRTRSADLVRTGQEFLAASWFAAGMGGASPIDVGASAYRDLTEVLEHAAGTGRPVLTLSPLISGRDDALAPAVREVESYRGDTDRALVDLRAHVATGGTAVLVVGGHGTAQRSLEQLREADVPAELVDRLTQVPTAGLVTVTCGQLTDGFTTDRLVVLSEADLTGNRAVGEVRKLASRRRNAVDLVTLKPGDHVVHSQHGIGRFVEMRERTVGGATREYLVLEYASSKRGQPPDRLFVPTDALDEISRYVGGEVPALN
jgi:transcription-repair coupling factor (superfamily II helicase)